MSAACPACPMLLAGPLVVCSIVQILLAWLFQSAEGKPHGEPEDVQSIDAAMDLTKAHEAVGWTRESGML